MSKHVILKFEQSAEQVRGPVLRVVGFISGKAMVTLLDAADLSANPRSAKSGSVTTDIMDSLAEAPDLFAFKTKGILIGSSRCRALERQRYEVFFDDPQVEGILDGGHNCLAIGNYILQLAGLTQREVKAIHSWDDLKRVWAENRERIGALDGELDFVVPTELLVPAKQDDIDTVEEFTPRC